jgi:hypothetical protein
MAGWVLGLGDRHLSNCLMHLPTGALIQIDLGIAFEQVSCRRPDLFRSAAVADWTSSGHQRVWMLEPPVQMDETGMSQAARM